MKKALHAEPRGKRCREENLFKFYLRNFQTPSCFYQFCSHGLILSSHQVFHYAELRRDRSEDGLYVASFFFAGFLKFRYVKLIKFVIYLSSFEFTRPLRNFYIRKENGNLSVFY